MSDRSPITTTNGETFTYADHCDLAVLIYRRFGRDIDVALKAWHRLMENNCTWQAYMALVSDAVIK